MLAAESSDLWIDCIPVSKERRTRTFGISWTFRVCVCGVVKQNSSQHSYYGVVDEGCGEIGCLDKAFPVHRNALDRSPPWHRQPLILYRLSLRTQVHLPFSQTLLWLFLDIPCCSDHFGQLHLVSEVPNLSALKTGSKCIVVT